MSSEERLIYGIFRDSSNIESSGLGPRNSIIKGLTEYNRPENFFDLENLENLYKKIEGCKEFKLSDQEKNTLISKMEKMSPHEIADNFETPDSYQKYSDLSKKLDDSLGVKCFKPFVNEKLFPFFVYKGSDMAFQEDNLEFLKEAFKLDEQKTKDALLDYFIAKEESSDAEEIKSSTKKLQTSSFWNFLSQIGIEKEILKILGS
jgi:hypothetical protein